MEAHIVMEELIISPEQAITTQPVTTRPVTTGRLDWFGVLCSFGCAVHCAAMPVLIATLPSLTTLRWLADPLFHQLVAVMCAVLVARAIVPGYRKHRNSRVITLAGVGIGLLFTAAFILPDTCCSVATRSQISSEVANSRPKIVLVSSTNAVSSSTATPSNQFARFSVKQSPESDESCESGNCPHVATFSRPLLSAIELEGQLGTTAAQTLIRAQPFLSPIGGLFLIVAHVMNIRLRCCRRAPCGKS